MLKKAIHKAIAPWPAPAARAPLPGLCRRLCCIGASPWCSTIPSPPPGLQGVISEAPAHSSRQTSGVPWLLGHRSAPSRRHTCMQDPGRPPHGVATLPTAKLPPSHTSWRPSGSGSNCFPSPTLKDVNSSVQPSPSCQRTHLSPILRDLPWVAVLSCPLLASNTQFYVFQL